MRHHYIGVEHLFIALLELRHSLADHLITKHNFSREYIIDIIRRKTGKGGRYRLWAGVPFSPRAEIVLNIANEIAITAGHSDISEQDLLLAIIEEGDSIPVRVLEYLGIDLEDAHAHFTQEERPASQSMPYVKVDLSTRINQSLDQDALFILRHLYRQEESISVEYQFHPTYNAATLLHIRRQNGELDIIKLDQLEDVLDEFRRIEQHNNQHTQLRSYPPYVQVSNAGDRGALMYRYENSQSLRTLSQVQQSMSGDDLAEWVEFQLWQSLESLQVEDTYSSAVEIWQLVDWMLPHALNAALMQVDLTPSGIHVLRYPIKADKLTNIHAGDHILVENFTVLRTDPDSGTLLIGLGAAENNTHGYRIQISGINFDDEAYFRGEVVDRLIAQVTETRNTITRKLVEALAPPFNKDATELHIGNFSIRNPLHSLYHWYPLELPCVVNTIHGALVCDSILLDDDDTPHLVDYGLMRKGPVILDWVMLEISLIVQMNQGITGTWQDAAISVRKILSNDKDSPVYEKLTSVRKTIHRIIRDYLIDPSFPIEYFLLQGFVALHNALNENYGVQTRRLLFLLAAAAFERASEIESDVKQ